MSAPTRPSNAGRAAPMPGILYGTAWKRDRTAGLVESALRLGFRGIDTACQPKHYDEAGVGTGIAAALGAGLRRPELYLQTKFTPLSGQDPARLPYAADAPPAAQVAQSFAASLANLRTDYLDCLVLHSPLPDPNAMREVWRAMETLAESGGTLSLGLSNCYSTAYFRAFHRAARVKPTVLQNRFHAETGYDQELRAFCRAEGVTYQSFWTLTANGHLLEHPTALRLAAAHRRTPAQILFRYLTQVDVAPLSGTTSERHMREDLGIFDFELSTEDCIALAGLLA